MAGAPLKEYLHWKEERIEDFSDSNITALYDKGFVFTRLGKGILHQTRSVRIDLDKFELTSENRRILKKVEKMEIEKIPLPYSKYNWQLGKMAKDFYDTKFDKGIFSVQKIKELLASMKSNFNLLLKYDEMGYAICYESKILLHYSYPFYDLEKAPKDMGLGMMTKTILLAKEEGLKYIYLGSLQRTSDVYKLQFEGLEWFDGKDWNTDIKQAKELLNKKSLQ